MDIGAWISAKLMIADGFLLIWQKVSVPGIRSVSTRERRNFRGKHRSTDTGVWQGR